MFTTLAGFANGARDPETNAVVVPPRIDDFDDPGLGQRQSYSVTMIRNGRRTRIENADASPFYAVPVNAGPRTMDYAALFEQGTYRDTNKRRRLGVGGYVGRPVLHRPRRRVRHRQPARARGRHGRARRAVGRPGRGRTQNFAGDTVSGFAVNSIAIEVPIELLTRDGKRHAASERDAVIGIWATTSRPRVLVRRTSAPARAAAGARSSASATRSSTSS